MYSVTITGHFDAAHFLYEYQGKCANMHGHRWNYQITVKSRFLNNQFMLMDFGDMKAAAKELAERFDHQVINDIFPFNSKGKISPTAECLAKYFYDELAKTQHFIPRFTRVRIFESPDCFAEYFEGVDF